MNSSDVYLFVTNMTEVLGTRAYISVTYEEEDHPICSSTVNITTQSDQLVRRKRATTDFSRALLLEFLSDTNV